MWDITPPPVKEFELRIIVWETEDITIADIEETSDIYVTANVNELEKAKSTDVHYRSQNGAGSFNWRILLDIKYPSDYHFLHIKVFDNDFFKHDDYLGGKDFNIKPLIEDVYDLDIPIHLDKRYYELMKNSKKNLTETEKTSLEDFDFSDSNDDNKFWLQMYNVNSSSNK